MIENDSCFIYFKDGTFLHEKLANDIISEFEIVFSPKLGFLKFDKVWKIIDEEELRNKCQIKLRGKYKSLYVNETIKCIKDETYISLDKINNNKNRLVLLNGTLDLSDWNNLIFYKDEYFKTDYCTIMLNCNYNKNSKYNIFIKFLNDIFNNDQQIINVVKEMFGYCLITDTRLETSFILYGAGSNGKSTLLKVLQKLLTDENVSSVSINDLNRIFARVNLYGKLANISTELEERIISTSTFKQVVSGEQILASYKGKDEFHFKPFCKLIFALNKLPKVRDRSHGFFRRLQIIPFENTYEGKNKDVFLDNKLNQEIDGILQFAIEGLTQLYNNCTFTYSDKVNEYLKEYKNQRSSIEEFLDDSVELDKDSNIPCKEIYDLYKIYCIQNGFKGILNNVNFGKEILKYHSEVTKKRITINSKKENCYNGIRLI